MRYTGTIEVTFEVEDEKDAEDDYRAIAETMVALQPNVVTAFALGSPVPEE